MSGAAISPEYQGCCCCRRGAQRSTLAVLVSCSLHMRMLPFVAPDIKTELYFSCLLRRGPHRLFLLYQVLLFLYLTLLLTSGPFISSVFTFFSLILPLPIYRWCFFLFSLLTCLLSHLLSACQHQSCFIRAARINYATAEVDCTRLKTSKKLKRQRHTAV